MYNVIERIYRFYTSSDGVYVYMKWQFSKFGNSEVYSTQVITKIKRKTLPKFLPFLFNGTLLYITLLCHGTLFIDFSSWFWYFPHYYTTSIKQIGSNQNNLVWLKVSSCNFSSQVLANSVATDHILNIFKKGRFTCF